MIGNVAGVWIAEMRSLLLLKSGCITEKTVSLHVEVVTMHHTQSHNSEKTTHPLAQHRGEMG